MIDLKNAPTLSVGDILKDLSGLFQLKCKYAQKNHKRLLLQASSERDPNPLNPKVLEYYWNWNSPPPPPQNGNDQRSLGVGNLGRNLSSYYSIRVI